MGKIKELWTLEERQMCNDCSSIGDIQVSFVRFPDIVVCDSCFNRYYVRKENANTRYR